MTTNIELLTNNPEEKTLLVLEPVSELYNELTVTVHKGKRVTTKGEGKEAKTTETPGFIVLTDKAKGFGVKIEAAITAFLKDMKYGTKDDFAYDVEAEFFQPTTKPNVDNTNPFTGENAEELLALRETIQSEAEAAEEDEANAQSHWLRVSIAVDQAFVLCGTSKKVERWATGDGANDDVSKAPWLESLGGAIHALREARYMAQLNEVQFDHLAATINRGKAIDLEIRKGTEDFINGGAEAAALDYEVFEDPFKEGRDIMSTQTVETAMRGAIDATGVSEDYSTIAGGIALVKEVSKQKQAAAAAAGVTKHSAGDGERAILREIVGLEQLVVWLQQCDAAITGLRAAENNEDESTYDKALGKALRAYTGSSFYRRTDNAIGKLEGKRAAEAKKRGAEKAAQEGESFQGAKKAMAELSARDLAARIYASMKDHSQYMAVLDEVTIMCRAQQARDDARAKAARDDARAKATAEAAKQAAE